MKYYLALTILTLPTSAHAGLCATRDLVVGQQVDVADFAPGVCSGDLANADDVVGQTLLRAVQRGVGLRRSLLATVFAVKRGQRVVFTVDGVGFAVDGSGAALANGRVGEVIAVDCGDRKHPRRVLLEGNGRGRIVD